MDETDDDMLCNGSEEDGDVRSECGEGEGTDCEDGDSDTDWYREIESDMLYIIKCTKLIVKYFFLADILFLGVVLYLDEYIFPWQMWFFGGLS
jgi:hypothetical protein